MNTTKVHSKIIKTQNKIHTYWQTQYFFFGGGGGGGDFI